MAEEIGKPPLSHGGLDLFYVHGYEQTFWHVDTVAGPRGSRGFSRRQLMARDLGRLGKEPEVHHYEHSPGLLQALKGIALLIPVQRGAAPQTLREGKDQGGGPGS